MTLPTLQQLQVPTLGPCSIACTFQTPFVDEARRVLISSDAWEVQPILESRQPLPAFEPAGPRQMIYFDPGELVCGIVTCRGAVSGDQQRHPLHRADADPSLCNFSERGSGIAIQYIDPSYAIRSQPANSIDAEFCLALGQHAAHAGMAGRTDMMVGDWNQRFTHVPIAVAAAQRRELDPRGPVWQRVLEMTGQPASIPTP